MHQIRPSNHLALIVSRCTVRLQITNTDHHFSTCLSVSTQLTAVIIVRRLDSNYTSSLQPTELQIRPTCVIYCWATL